MNWTEYLIGYVVSGLLFEGAAYLINRWRSHRQHLG